MKKLLCLSVIGLFVFAALGISFAQETQVNKQEVNVGNKVCPVSGENIDEETKATYEYQGKVYNFCCPECIEEFKKDPEKYIKNIEEELKAQDKEELKKMKMPAEDEMPMEMHGHEHHPR